MKFSYHPYRRADADEIVRDYNVLVRLARRAQTPADLMSVWDEHEQLDTGYSRMARIANIRHTIDTRDKFYDDEVNYYNDATPRVGNAQLELYRAVLDSPYRAALSDKYGTLLLRKLEISVKSADDRVLELMQAENALCSEYQNLYASAMVLFEGNLLPLPKLGPYKQSRDRAVRRAAFEAEGYWFDEHRHQLDSIYTRMIQNRNAQAVALGFADYSELSYLRMGRIGYGPREVACYRSQILQDVVPVVRDGQLRHFARIGLPDAKYYDIPVNFLSGNAMPVGKPVDRLVNCHKMYHELSPETAEFIDFMFENEMYDVMSKPGKAPGGYMEQISGYGPFVFANWNGTADDVDTLTHEMGHAFQGYMAQKQGLISELRDPSMESCEIHSMSMEFLTSPWHELFFGANTQKYQLAHAEESLFFLPYGTMVDDFQEIMYKNPSLSPDQRNEVWLALEHKYRPWIDFDRLPFYSRGAGWQRQLHIYLYPFYYIDYCLAQTVALQFFLASQLDPDDAWQRYLALVKKGGTDTYAGLVTAAGFDIPYTPGALAPIANQMADWIAKHQCY